MTCARSDNYARPGWGAPGAQIAHRDAGHGESVDRRPAELADQKVTFLGTCLAGLSDGSLYALVAVGFSLVFASSGVIDFSRGQLVAVGAFLSYLLIETRATPVGVALIAVLAAVAVIGVIQFGAAVSPLRGEGRAAGWLVSTLAFGIGLQALAQLSFDGGSHSVREPFRTSAFSVGDVPFDGYRIVVIVVAVAVVATTWAVLRLTPTGRCLRAVSEDVEAAALRGINVRRYTLGTFAAAAALAALAGVVFAPITSAFLAQSPLFTVKGFIAMVLGGTGSIWGALVGGLALGVTEQLGSGYVDAASRDLFGLALLLVVLLIRPQGVFASRQLRRA